MLPPGMNLDNNASNFYFYNPVAVEFGKKEFQSIWGKRILKDNWRLSSSSSDNNLNQVSTDSIADLSKNNKNSDLEVNPKYEFLLFFDKSAMLSVET